MLQNDYVENNFLRGPSLEVYLMLLGHAARMFVVHT